MVLPSSIRGRSFAAASSAAAFAAASLRRLRRSFFACRYSPSRFFARASKHVIAHRREGPAFALRAFPVKGPADPVGVDPDGSPERHTGSRVRYCQWLDRDGGATRVVMRRASRFPLFVALILGAITLSFSPRTLADGDDYDPEYEPCVTRCVSSECEGAGGACGQGSSYDCEHDKSLLERCARQCEDQ
jgi:hypothetical protein